MPDKYEYLYELSEIADKSLRENKEVPLETIIEVRNIVSGKGFIGMAQINPTVGDIEYNAKKIANYIKYANEIELDMTVFPELSLMGCPIEDTIDRYKVIVEDNIKWLEGLAKITTKTTALVGFIEPRKTYSEGKKYYNSIGILRNGKISGIIRKSLIPNYSEFNEYRYIEASPISGVQPVDTMGNFDKYHIVPQSKILDNKYGICIGEDCWNNKEFFEKNLYERDTLEELYIENPEIFINCSASPTRERKEQLKHNLLSFLSKKYKTPFIYVNQVGAIDNYSFDGSSRVYDGNGKLIARAKSFEEQLLLVNPLNKIGKIYPLPEGLENHTAEKKNFNLEYESDLDRTYKTCIQGIRDYFRKCGLKRAVLGLSGGLDSTVCAVLLADALGKENVLGISMPSKITSIESTSDAKILADNLGINYAVAPIKNMVDTTTECFNELFNSVEEKWNCRFEKSFTPDNIQARSRAMFLWGVSNEFRSCIPIATSDKSEAYMGYATINGDMSGGFAPIADIPKTKLFAFAKWLNKNREEKNAIPESVIQKKPGAELAINPKTGKPLIAEDALMPYEFLDEIIWRVENKNEGYNELLEAEFLYEKHHPISKEQKIEWLDKFYKRSLGALYKLSILPPSIIVEAHSINKSEYSQPITSGNINYKGVTEDYIQEIL